MALQLSDPFLFATPLLVFIPRVLVPLSPSILRAVRSVHAAQLVYPPVHWEDGHLGSPPLAAASRSQGPSKDRNYTPSFLIDLPPTGPSIRRSVSTFPFEPDRLSFRNRIDPRFVRGRVPILRPASLHFFHGSLCGMAHVLEISSDEEEYEARAKRRKSSIVATWNKVRLDRHETRGKMDTHGRHGDESKAFVHTGRVRASHKD